MYTYTIHIYTGSLSWAGTNANVHLTLCGVDGESDEQIFTNDEKTFNSGMKNTFTIDTQQSLGALTTVRVGHDNTGWLPGWFVVKIEVEEDHTGKGVLFECNQWFDLESGDGHIRRDLTPTEQYQRKACLYKISFHTGTVMFAGTDANVYVAIYGTKGESAEVKFENLGSTTFENGKIDTYDVETKLPLGTLTKVRVGHDNTGSGPGWFLDKITVEDTVNNQTVVFPCDRWLASNADDGMIERQLVGDDFEKRDEDAKRREEEEERKRKEEEERRLKEEDEKKRKEEERKQKRENEKLKKEEDRKRRIEEERLKREERKRRLELEIANENEITDKKDEEERKREDDKRKQREEKRIKIFEEKMRKEREKHEKEEDPEEKRRNEEEEEKRRIEEERKLQEEKRKKEEEEKRKKEEKEKLRIEEEKRKQEEEEKRRKEEEKRRKEEEENRKRQEEETRKRADEEKLKREEEEKRRKEEEEKRRIEEEEKLKKEKEEKRRTMLLEDEERKRLGLYKVNLFTEDAFGTWTGANILFTLYGTDGESSELCIKSEGEHSFGDGMKGTLAVQCAHHLGTLDHIRIRPDQSGVTSPWFLVTVEDPKTNDIVVFTCNRSIDTEQSDKPHMYYPSNTNDVKELLAVESDLSENWTRVKKTRKAEVWRKKETTPETPTITKAQLLLKGVPYESAIKYFTDWEHRREWDKTFGVIDILEQIGHFKVIYCSNKMPLFCKKRDMVLACLDHHDQQYHTQTMCSILHPDVPQVAKTSKIRAKTFMLGIVIRPVDDGTQSSKVTVITQVDLRGSAPQLVKNSHLTNSPIKWMKMMRKYHKKKSAESVKAEDQPADNGSTKNNTNGESSRQSQRVSS